MKKNIKYIILTIFIVVLSIFGFTGDDIKDYLDSISNSTDKKIEAVETFDVSTDLKIYFLDVGEADSILIQNNGENMLIDAGNNEDGPKLVKYFKSLGIEKIKYVVGTHPHEDHIGGIDNILKEFKVTKLFMPDVTTNTTTFESVLDIAKDKGLNVTIPKINSTYKLGEAKFKFLYSGNNKEDLNSCSIIVKLYFGKKSFLFMADLPSTIEEKLLDKDIKSDVLKVGHHGSSSSSSKEFLDIVKPKYAIISVGKNNDYHHPHTSVLNRLKKVNAKIYRTDKSGTILLTSTGDKIKIKEIKTDVDGG